MTLKIIKIFKKIKNTFKDLNMDRMILFNFHFINQEDN
jgi:hypothetical protein